MKELYKNYTFTIPYDEGSPKWQQIDKELTVYEAYECGFCGKIYESEPKECQCGEDYFTTCEVYHDLQKIYVII